MLKGFKQKKRILVDMHGTGKVYDIFSIVYSKSALPNIKNLCNGILL